jgi:flagellar assembly protein FliH
MKTVISKDNIEVHNINKYKFKVLAIGGHDDISEISEQTQEAFSESTTSEPVINTNRDELVESLLKKTDDISSNFIKMQMKLEDQENEFKVELERVKKEAYEQGIADGKKILEEELDASKKNSLEQFTSAIERLNTSANEFETALVDIKEELTLAALEIAKEVIDEELHEHSNTIAKKLSLALISELINASKITLKVNPKDHAAVSERVSNLEHVKVISDSAISEGGVIAISDVGNIDSEIMKRYERIKKAALSG